MLAPKKLTGQYKWSFETRRVYIVGSKATERPVKEKQGNLLAWAEEQTQLAQWIRATGTNSPFSFQ
jgi:hypothetical protein